MRSDRGACFHRHVHHRASSSGQFDQPAAYQSVKLKEGMEEKGGGWCLLVEDISLSSSSAEKRREREENRTRQDRGKERKDGAGERQGERERKKTLFLLGLVSNTVAIQSLVSFSIY